MHKNCIMPMTEHIPTGIYAFTKTQWLDHADVGTVRIFATGRYVLYINDRYICEGPCRGHSGVRYYDEIETDAFIKGENRILVRVMQISDKSCFTSVFFTSEPELIFQAQVGKTRIESDESWRCGLDRRCALLPKPDRSLPPFEKVDFEETIVPLALRAREGFDFSGGMRTFYGMVQGYGLEKRPIPMLLPGEALPMQIVKRGDGYIDLDAGRYVTAKIDLKLPPDSDVKLIYSECYQTAAGKGLRDDPAGELGGYFDLFHTGKEEITYSPFWFRAFRYIRIVAEAPERYVEGLQARLFCYPLGEEAKFSCSDPVYNRMYEISLRTLQCCMQETFTDCPYYEQLQYIMDSAIEGAVLMRLSGDVRLVRKCIAEFAAAQLPEGLLPASYPSVIQQIIPGFGFFWVFLLRDYLEATADKAFVRQQLGTVDRLFCYFDAHMSPEGLITTSAYWDFVDWVSAWEKGVPPLAPGEVHTIYNMYYACALLCAKEICQKLDCAGFGAEYERKYEALCQKIRACCYDPRRGLYRDGPQSGGYSMHTVIWAVLSELEKGEAAVKLLSRLQEGELLKSSFAMNYYLFSAFQKCGQSERIFQNLAPWQKMMAAHCSTWWENPDAPRSECHGWSSAPAYVFSVELLGVKVGVEDKIEIRPYTAHLDWAEGVVPTRFGSVSVAWKKEGERLSVKISSPEGVRKQLSLPDGSQYDFIEGHFEI